MIRQFLFSKISLHMYTEACQSFSPQYLGFKGCMVLVRLVYTNLLELPNAQVSISLQSQGTGGGECWQLTLAKLYPDQIREIQMRFLSAPSLAKMFPL